MPLSAPLHRLKREAKLLSRDQKIPLHAALDRIAAQQGFARWSLLASTHAQGRSARLFAQLLPGDMVLIGARPGQGKTLLSVELAVEAMKAGQRAAFFTLEYTEAEVEGRFKAAGVDPAGFASLLDLDTSETICADHIVARLATAPRGTLAVIDYLQLLDRRRDTPDLATQVRTLRGFARARGLVFVVISQIHRSFDPSTKSCPDLADVRLINDLDLKLFSKACFLHNGEVTFAHVN
ncbi:MAG: DNA helicase [Rhodopseudomonas palustris]|uniref:DNA helicase n=1 Tax=Rhodopseudomonas palustris TaxID=1076 RepID=A0A933RUF1_RHOPL|nr:DNA helicase [Rhodopseudomonas palustris]